MEFVDEGIHRNNPDALRAAALIANGLGARARWVSHQGVDYGTFRRAILLRAKEKGATTTDAAATSGEAASGRAVPGSPSLPTSSRASSVDGDRNDDGGGGGGDEETRDWKRAGARRTTTTTSTRRASALRSAGAVRHTHASGVSRVRWSKMGPRVLAVGRECGVVELVAFERGRANASAPSSSPSSSSPSSSSSASFERVASLDGHTAAVTDIDWTLDGGALATSSLDGAVRLWSRPRPGAAVAADAAADDDDDASGGWRCARAIPCGAAVHAVRFHPINANLLVVGLETAAVWLLNASTGHRAACATSRSYMRSPVGCLAWNASGSVVYAGDGDGKVHVIACAQRKSKGPGTEKTLEETSTAAAVAAAPAPGTSKPPLPSTPRRREGGARVIHHLALVHRAKPPVAVSSLSGARASRAPPLKLPGGGGVMSLTHLPHWTGVCGGPGLVAVFKSGLVRVYGAPATTNKSPALTPLVTSQLPFWPGVSGAAALDVSVDLDSEDFLTSPPRAVASVGGGGGAATYAMPSRDGAPAMVRQGLSPLAPRGHKGAFNAHAVAADWSSDGAVVALGYGAVGEGGVAAWFKDDGGGGA